MRAGRAASEGAKGRVGAKSCSTYSHVARAVGRQTGREGKREGGDEEEEGTETEGDGKSRRNGWRMRNRRVRK